MSGLDKNTIALLHFNNSVIKDECGNTWTTGGSPAISSTQSKFGVKSLYLDGSSYLILPHSKIDISTGDFSVDFWVYYLPNSASTTGVGSFSTDSSCGFSPFSLRGSQSDGTAIGTYISAKSTWDITNSFSKVKLGNWLHYYIGRSGDTLLTAENGDIKCNKTVSGQISGLTYDILLGHTVTDGNKGILGYIDEFRISNVARWTENFTPPDSQYSPNSNSLYIDESNKVYGIT